MAIQKINETDLIYKVSPLENHLKNYNEIGFANGGKVKDHFNLLQVIESYRLFSERLGFDLLTKEHEEMILDHGNLELPFFLSGYDYGSPYKKMYDDVMTGLLWGYPIESTVSFVTRPISLLLGTYNSIIFNRSRSTACVTTFCLIIFNKPVVLTLRYVPSNNKSSISLK